MNKKTRRLSKIPDDVQTELKHIFVDIPFIVEGDTRKWSKLDESIVDHARSGVMPRWSDLDTNQHVNNVKYIGWILECVPMTIMENYELASMTLEYHRECRQDDVLKCHTCVLGGNNERITKYDHVDCQHLLQLEVGDGDKILKGRTKWRPKENC
ncbi:hypothetical protein L6452_21691 [Arctium lappa]|uniref:Uncharacterized protein n=1 Tax=Arctium lappa TaxID=4217 RepID=A0ACB9AXZ9_ARCLA|nr:hypothetical protein L6452_21691 [Arctium lappa]